MSGLEGLHPVGCVDCDRDGAPMTEGGSPDEDAADVDASADSTVPEADEGADSSVDATMSEDSTGSRDSAASGDASTPGDATDGADGSADGPGSGSDGAESGSAGDGATGEAEAGDAGMVDAGLGDAAATESGADTGSDCGPLNTIDNCSGCGLACNTTTAISESCNGGLTCTYVCLAGRADCNTTAPNLGGCECATPSCCGSACETIHQDGVGQNFYDCAPAGTYDQEQAIEACTAFTGNASACAAPLCGLSNVVCGANASQCACWAYGGSTSGHVMATNGTSNCVCPSSTSPTWN